jgi:hypothetical protein
VDYLKEFGGNITSTSLQLVLFFYQMGLIDTFTLIQFCVNSGTQYAAVVLGAASGNFSDIGLKVLFEPITGFGTGYQFIKAAKTLAERKTRIATLAAFLSTSTLSVTQLDPATNAAVGAAISTKIAYMRAILARGGGNQTGEYLLTPSLKGFAIVANSIKSPSLESHAYRKKFFSNCKISIDTILHDHTARRYFQASGPKMKIIAPTYLTPIVSTQVNTTAFIGFTTLGFGLIVFTSLGLLYLFERTERKRWKN